MNSINFARTQVVGCITDNGVRIIENNGNPFLSVSVSVRMGSGDNASYMFVEATANVKLQEWLTPGRFIGLEGYPDVRGFQKDNGEVGASLSLRGARVILDGMESTVLSGNVGRQDAIRVIDGPKGKFMSFPLAVNKGTKDKPYTRWFECLVNIGEGKPLPESMVQAISQGVPVLVMGDIVASPYMDKEGEAKASQKVYVNTIQVGRKVEANDAAGASQAGYGSAQPAATDNAGGIPQFR